MKHRIQLPSITFFFGITGLIASTYLAWQHYSPSQHFFCDFGGRISCSIINKSVYSELFGIPVALFGSLWFVVVIFLSWLALKKIQKVPLLLLLWSVLGAIFVFYLIYLEFILQAVCPSCFLVHAAVFSTLVMSFIMVRKQ